jgi:hypothetical protein
MWIFGGTPDTFLRHPSVPRLTGWESLQYTVQRLNAKELEKLGHNKKDLISL